MTATELLTLGGTGEASALARAVLAGFGAGFHLTTSRAGRTEPPGRLPGRVHIGGFGGAAGLAAYLVEHGVDRLIDATHPFAARNSAAARLACEAAGVPRLLLVRPPWRRQPLDRWIEVGSMAEAAEIVGRCGRRAFLTVGAGEVACFAPSAGVRFLVRLVDPPRRPLPLRSHEVVVGGGPLALAAESHLFERHTIDVLVCKASGGAATEAKIIAARKLGLPVIIVRRPAAEPGDAVEAALDWLAGAHRIRSAERIS
jgi:precorrin-6A/cobalt-precorrin-6A reductase